MVHFGTNAHPFAGGVGTVVWDQGLKLFAVIETEGVEDVGAAEIPANHLGL